MSRLARITSLASIVVTFGFAVPANASTPEDSPRTVYQENAHVASGSPSSGSSCDLVYYDHKQSAQACFQPYGDVFWLRDTARDGHHVEARAQVSPSGDGFRCYTYKVADGSWQKCTHFASKIPEGGSIHLTGAVYEGKKILSVGLGINSPTS